MRNTAAAMRRIAKISLFSCHKMVYFGNIIKAATSKGILAVVLPRNHNLLALDQKRKSFKLHH